MTSPSEWIHIADHGWDRYSVGCQYTIHQENDRWVARGFSLSTKGAAAKEVEEVAHSLNAAKQVVEKWESAGTCQQHP